ncbi:MAG: adenylate cyclase [Patescibacteria group bacterium]
MTNLETPTTGETRKKEIERKFLITDELPEGFLDHFARAKIRQGYLPVRAVGNEERVRHTKTYRGDDVYTRTRKQGAGIVREETEKVITRKVFDALWEKVEGIVEKTRYELPYEGSVIEYDVYGGALEGLKVAEVEFADEDQAQAFEPPNWFGEEVTGNPDFSNHSLATSGSPI